MNCAQLNLVLAVKRKIIPSIKTETHESFSKRVKAMQSSLQVGQAEYSKEHLFACQRTHEINCKFEKNKTS
jgi:hypothetical protein